MGQPPGLSGLAALHLPLSFDKNKKLQICNPGPKFLLMERINDDTRGEDKTLQNVSPFLIKKVIDSTCGGTVDFCKKLRNGTLLIKTKNIHQASALIKLCSLSQTIKVNVSEHKTLNYVRGVIYSNDLRELPDEEILSELKSQNVTEIKKILKKNDDKLVETGLIILTFASLELPNDINIGYEKVYVRPYIPMPLRCNNCFLYGHIAKNCNNKKVCANCSEQFHLNLEIKEPCLHPKCCVNCKTQQLENSNHAAFDKSCPIFIKEKELQAIMTLEKVNKKTATITYNNRHQSNRPTFANALNNNSTAITAPSIPPRKTVNYADVCSPTAPPNPPSTVNSNANFELLSSTNKYTRINSLSANNSVKVTEPISVVKPTSKAAVLPLRSSKRLKRQLKKSGLNGAFTKRADSSPSTEFMEAITSDTSSVDMEITTNDV